MKYCDDHCHVVHDDYVGKISHERSLMFQGSNRRLHHDLTAEHI
jgi:hypothetical protein